MHLIGNMLFLWVFGDNVEDDMGHARYLAFYLLCGTAGGIAHALANPASEAPLIAHRRRSPARSPPMSSCIRG